MDDLTRPDKFPNRDLPGQPGLPGRGRRQRRRRRGRRRRGHGEDDALPAGLRADHGEGGGVLPGAPLKDWVRWGWWGKSARARFARKRCDIGVVELL